MKRQVRPIQSQAHLAKLQELVAAGQMSNGQLQAMAQKTKKPLPRRIRPKKPLK